MENIIDKAPVKLTQTEKDSAAAKTAADARVVKVTADIEAAKVERERVEKESGVVEAPGAKSDREAKEKKDLAEAAEVRKIEVIEGSHPDATVRELIVAVNKLVNQANGRKD